MPPIVASRSSVTVSPAPNAWHCHLSWMPALLLTSMDLQPADPASCTFERPRIEAFDMHPLDYALMQQAAALSGLPVADFMQLAIYRYSHDLVAQWAETRTHSTSSPTAQHQSG